MIRKRNNKRALYESIMKDVAKTVKRHLNEVSTELLGKADKKALADLKKLLTKFKKSDFSDEDILKLLQKRARQSKVFKQGIIDNNNALEKETYGKFNKIINKWKNGIKINGDNEIIEIIPTFIISKEIETNFWSNNYDTIEDHTKNDPELYLDIYLINIETYKELVKASKLLSDTNKLKIYTSIVSKINNIYDNIIKDFESLGLELYDTLISEIYNDDIDDYEYEYQEAKSIINDLMCIHFKLSNEILEKYFNDDFFNEDSEIDSRIQVFRGWSRDEETTFNTYNKKL